MEFYGEETSTNNVLDVYRWKKSDNEHNNVIPQSLDIEITTINFNIVTEAIEADPEIEPDYRERLLNIISKIHADVHFCLCYCTKCKKLVFSHIETQPIMHSCALHSPLLKFDEEPRSPSWPGIEEYISYDIMATGDEVNVWYCSGCEKYHVFNMHNLYFPAIQDEEMKQLFISLFNVGNSPYCHMCEKALCYTCAPENHSLYNCVGECGRTWCSTCDPAYVHNDDEDDYCSECSASAN
jgi:hypothetical protein